MDLEVEIETRHCSVAAKTSSLNELVGRQPKDKTPAAAGVPRPRSPPPPPEGLVSL